MSLSLSLILRLPPTHTLFPYTTLFRSTSDQCGLCHGFVTRINYAYQGMAEEEQRDQLSRRAPLAFTTPAGTNRSEEHTSELQSQFHLVCRLLLEKKKIRDQRHNHHAFA